MNNSSQPAAVPQTMSPLEAFGGSIEPTKTGLLYQAGLAVVALAMILLPLIYMGLIAATAWGVIYHLQHDLWILDGSGGGRAGFGRLLIYLAPAVVGGILVFFMVKPFFAARQKPPEPITLDPAKEPLLFAFVRKICGLVGAAVPCRIDVDCDVNASASLRRGLWSRDLVLTIGLPLVSGLDMRQFAGVLAHEFGHFAQGAGMRLTYIIRRINAWFARVVYERDEWDLKLDSYARGTDFRIGIILHMARGCVWLTRRILWALMHAGHAISCFMLRQMEFDADSYEAKVAGSDAFESTAARLRLLTVATRSAYEDVQQSWTSKRLPESLPLLIGHKAQTLPADVQQKITDSAASEKTGWFDTHPCDADRMAAARRLGQAGVFRLSQPATGLFSDFGELSKVVTRHQYAKHLELEFTDQNLMSSEEILRESAASEQAEAMIRKFYGGVNFSLKPLLPPEGEWPPVADSETGRVKWHEARQSTETLRAEAEEASMACSEQQRALADFMAAHLLTKASFKLDPKEFGLPAHATTTGEQEIAARQGVEEASALIAEKTGALERFMSALSERVILALSFAKCETNPVMMETESEVTAMLRLLAAIGTELPWLHELGSRLKPFVLLAQNRANHSDPALVDRVVAELAAEMKERVDRLQKRLQGLPYPFPHARGRLTVAEYAAFEGSEGHEWIKIYQDATAHVERLFALHYRLMGRVLAVADAGEKTLESASQLSTLNPQLP